MTRKELKKTVSRIAHIYGNRFTMTQEIFDTWYTVLGKYEYDDDITALIGQFPPTAADLAKFYAGKEEQARVTDKQVRNVLDLIISTYPSGMAGDAQDAFYERIGNFPRDEWESRAERLRAVVNNYVKMSEQFGTELKPLGEFIRGL